MVRSLSETIIEVLNAFPSKNGVFDTISSFTIVEGKPKTGFEEKMISFGSYALVYTGISNYMKSRALSSIVLMNSDSARENHFVSLHTGHRIHG